MSSAYLGIIFFYCIFSCLFLAIPIILVYKVIKYMEKKKQLMDLQIENEKRKLDRQ